MPVKQLQFPDLPVCIIAASRDLRVLVLLQPGETLEYPGDIMVTGTDMVTGTTAGTPEWYPAQSVPDHPTHDFPEFVG